MTQLSREESLEEIKNSLVVMQENINLCRMKPELERQLWMPISVELNKLLCESTALPIVTIAFPNLEFFPTFSYVPEDFRPHKFVFRIKTQFGPGGITHYDPFDRTEPKIPLSTWLKQVLYVSDGMSITIEDYIKLPRHKRAAHVQKLGGKPKEIVQGGWIFVENGITNTSFTRLLIDIADYVIAELSNLISVEEGTLFSSGSQLLQKLSIVLPTDFAQGNPDRLATLNYDIGRYVAVVQDGKLDEASKLFHKRLCTPLLHSGAYEAIIQLLVPLFPSGLNQLPALSSLNAQSDQIGNLSAALFHTGDYEQAIRLQDEKLRIDLIAQHPGNVGVSLLNISDSLRVFGRLALAEHMAEHALRLAETYNLNPGIALSCLKLFIANIDMGQWNEAEAYYARLCNLLPDQPITAWHAAARRYYATMLFYTNKYDRDVAEQALESALSCSNVHEQIAILQLIGEFYLSNSNLSVAAKHFQEALALSSTVKHHGGLGHSAGGLARTRARQNRMDEVSYILESYELRPLDAAELYQATGRTEEAATHAIMAYEAAWADGPPYSFHHDLERASRLLAALDLGAPELEVFDLSQKISTPYDAAIEALIGKA